MTPLSTLPRFPKKSFQSIAETIKSRVAELSVQFKKDSPEAMYVATVGKITHLVYAYLQKLSMSKNAGKGPTRIPNEMASLKASFEDSRIALKIAKDFQKLYANPSGDQKSPRGSLVLDRRWPPMPDEVEMFVISHLDEAHARLAGPTTILFPGYSEEPISSPSQQLPHYLRTLANHIQVTLRGRESYLQRLVVKWAKSHHGAVDLLPLPRKRKLSLEEKAAIVCSISELTGIDGGLCPNSVCFPDKGWQVWLAFHVLTAQAQGLSEEDVAELSEHLDTLLSELTPKRAVNGKKVHDTSKSDESATAKKLAKHLKRENESTISDDWEAQRIAGLPKAIFAKQRGFKDVKEFQKLLDRVAKRRGRSEE